MAAPETSGLRRCTQPRLSAWRVAKLSVQSRTTSFFEISFSIWSPSTRAATSTISTSGLTALRAARRSVRRRLGLGDRRRLALHRLALEEGERLQELEVVLAAEVGRLLLARHDVALGGCVFGARRGRVGLLDLGFTVLQVALQVGLAHAGRRGRVGR